ncbi:oligosaccharide repeat unit polymerase [Micromonospora sp. ATA32]|nr:oligosaccharide repeat unit polymerase [Micromonospora sp. ATA32]
MRRNEQRLWATATLISGGACLILVCWSVTSDAPLGLSLGLAVAALVAWHASMRWLAACAAVWALALIAMLVFPGPYDSSAGRAAVPVLAGYAAAFLGAWALGRQLARAAGAPSALARPELRWPSDQRLRMYLLVLLAVAVLATVIRFRGSVPALFAENPDVARQAQREQSNILVGLLSEAWTLGVSISLLRALTLGGRGRALYYAFTFIFILGAALGGSRNSVLVGVVPGLIASLSVRRPQRRTSRSFAKSSVVTLVGIAVIGTIVFLGGQRTLAGTGAFETEFRARYGGSALTASAGSLDLSLSSSGETFGRLWAQRESLAWAHGAYSLTFLGSLVQPVFGDVDLYGITSQLSWPYYMNTATFVAIPLLDYGPVGAAIFLVILGLCVGLAERRLEFTLGPAQHLARGLIVYFAAFGIYELYPFIYPTWLSLIPGLWVLHRLGRGSKGE